MSIATLLLLFFSYGLGDESSHPISGFSPHIPGDVGVGIQGKARAVVPQDVGHRLDVHALLDRQGCERMPLRYNKNQPPKFLVKSRLFGGFVANVLH